MNIVIGFLMTQLEEFVNCLNHAKVSALSFAPNVFLENQVVNRGFAVLQEYVRYVLNRSSWRKRGMTSNPLFIIPDIFLHFPNELCYGYLRLEGNGKIPLGRYIEKKVCPVGYLTKINNDDFSFRKEFC